MFCVWTPPLPLPPPHAYNCDTNAHIKFIFDTAIDGPEWNCGRTLSKPKWPMAGNMLQKPCASHNFIANEPINFIFDVAIDLPGRKVPIDLGENRHIKLHIDMKGREMRSKVRRLRWPFRETSSKNKSFVLI